MSVRCRVHTKSPRDPLQSSRLCPECLFSLLNIYFTLWNVTRVQDLLRGWEKYYFMATQKICQRQKHTNWEGSKDYEGIAGLYLDIPTKNIRNIIKSWTSNHHHHTAMNAYISGSKCTCGVVGGDGNPATPANRVCVSEYFVSSCRKVDIC